MELKIEICTFSGGSELASIYIQSSDSAEEIGRKIKAEMDVIFEYSCCDDCGQPNYTEKCDCGVFCGHEADPHPGTPIHPSIQRRFDNGF